MPVCGKLLICQAKRSQCGCIGWTHNPLVAGSSPARPTKYLCGFAGVLHALGNARKCGPVHQRYSAGSQQ